MIMKKKKKKKKRNRNGNGNGNKLSRVQVNSWLYSFSALLSKKEEELFMFYVSFCSLCFVLCELGIEFELKKVMFSF